MKDRTAEIATKLCQFAMYSKTCMTRQRVSRTLQIAVKTMQESPSINGLTAPELTVVQHVPMFVCSLMDAKKV